MSQLASNRYGVALAPGGLILTQELLNTTSAGKPRLPDLLDDVEQAELWLAGAVNAWAQRTGRRAAPVGAVEIGEARLPRIRALRTRLRAALAGDREEGREVDGAGISGTITLTLRGGNAVDAEPRGDGLAWLKSTLLLETYLSQRDDTWRRLKVCRNPICRAAFYDQSNNNSGVWHNVHVCGNAANLRASRARRRDQVGAPR